jgi:hypothetical protein
MNVHPQGIQLLVQAQRDGIADIPTLRKWLKGVERQGQYTAVSSVGLALNRLMASRSLREWLEWPANRFEILPEGALFFACKGNGWDRQQLLQAVLLGAMQVEGVRLIIHGFSGKVVPVAHLGSQERIVISNGPLLSNSVVILTECHAHGIEALARRFLASDAYLSEKLALLGRGEGIVVAGDKVFFATWNGRVTGRDNATIISDT